MKENVGTIDRIVRSITGPALILFGYSRWGGDNGQFGGLPAMITGVTLIESAITRVCPVNALLRIDTREQRLIEKDLGLDRQAAWEVESRPPFHGQSAIG